MEKIWRNVQVTKGEFMKLEIKDYLRALRFGEVQCHRNISVIPLLGVIDSAPPYIALADAMAAQSLTVTEVCEEGSVPQLLVLNDGTMPVLIIDGEELVGVKQNRVLNTSILLKERSRTVVPVSCTERGRWTYTSTKFSTSEQVLEHKIRSRKSRSVYESLAQGKAHQSNQGEIWDGIQMLHYKAKSSSSTSAMLDAFKAEAARLTECLHAFPRTMGQVGLVVLINDRIAGFDVVSRLEVYARLHDKLVRSYVLDSLFEEPRSAAVPAAAEAHVLARAFIDSLAASREEVFPSVGYGHDHRYHQAGLTGSALVHENRLVHAVFLSLNADTRADQRSEKNAQETCSG